MGTTGSALILAAAAALLATAACSGSPTPATTEPATTEPATTEPATTEPATTEPASSATAAETSVTPNEAPSAPAADCLSGTYRLDRFLGAGEKDTYGTGEGGDITVGFTDRGYTLKGAGQDPIKLTLAGGTGNLTVDGTVRGTYTGTGPTYDFIVGTSTGTATLSVGGQRQRLDMADAANLLAPDGRAVLACNPPRMVLLLSTVRLELSRA